MHGIYVRVPGSPGRAPKDKSYIPLTAHVLLPPCTGFPGCLQCTERAGRQLQIWNITVKHAGAWVASEHLWTGTATGKTESEFYLCFQTHKENQDQPKYH